MVIYDLTCDRSHSFEGWFTNRDEFETQLEEGLIACPLCGSNDLVEKPVAPAVHVGGSRAKQLDAQKRQQLAAKAASKVPASKRRETLLRAAVEVVKSTLEKHYDDVGEGFSDEAIAMYVGDEEPRNISGTTTPEEEEELEELGVPFGKIFIPRFDD